MLLGDSGVGKLLTRATFDHTDNRPRLEFVAARRFLDPGASAFGVFDSLMQIGSRADGMSPMGVLRVLALRRGDASVLGYLDAARRAQPEAAEWSVRAAGIRLALGDTTTADSLLNAALARFRAAKDSIYAAVRAVPDLPERDAHDVLQYFDQFYQVLGNPGMVNREFVRACRTIPR